MCLGDLLTDWLGEFKREVSRVTFSDSNGWICHDESGHLRLFTEEKITPFLLKTVNNLLQGRYYFSHNFEPMTLIDWCRSIPPM